MHVLQIIFPAKTIGVFHISTLRHSHKPWCHKVFSTTVPRGNPKRALVATGPGPALARIVCPAACGAPLGSPTAPPRGWTLGRCWSRYEPRTSWAEEKQPEKGRVLLEKNVKNQRKWIWWRNMRNIPLQSFVYYFYLHIWWVQGSTCINGCDVAIEMI